MKKASEILTSLIQKIFEYSDKRSEQLSVRYKAGTLKNRSYYFNIMGADYNTKEDVTIFLEDFIGMPEEEAVNELNKRLKPIYDFLNN
ncbi:hypothetical protein EZS27_009363 [termite gut metagenome]|uniref:Uncharacterized protein n=1 Tax=termite gut metagenome TaxID=433724 RepID=A0A5J4SC90_9ZZZZ